MKPSIWFPLLTAAWLVLGLCARFVFAHAIDVSLSLAVMWLYSLPLTGIATFAGAMICYNAYAASDTAQARLWVWMISAGLHLALGVALLVRFATL